MDASNESCQPPRPGGAHAAAIRRMIDASPPFRPGAGAGELVAAFAEPGSRMPAFLALSARGRAALPAVRDGLRHPDSHVRRWCVILADNVADAATLRAVVPLLDDPCAGVRRWAVHTLACECCKDGPNPVDAVPLLLERIERDPSIRVRRQAVAMLAHHRAPDPRAAPVLRRLAAEAADRKLRLHAARGLERYAAAGVGSRE